MKNKCGICGGDNDIGEICIECAKSNKESTLAYMLKYVHPKDIAKYNKSTKGE